MTYEATVEYETKKRNRKTVTIPVDARTEQAAERRAALLVRSNGQRQVRTIKSVTIREQRRVGLFRRLFGRGN